MYVLGGKVACVVAQQFNMALLFVLQGIYRVSGVKSKVESLCQRFDLNPELVDLEEVHPNIISNVLKLYLRQVRIVQCCHTGKICF